MVERIGLELQAIYEEVLQEPPPERFRKLLEELESGEKIGQARQTKASAQSPSTAPVDFGDPAMSPRPRSRRAWRLQPAE